MDGFRCGRDFSAWLDLVPRQCSTGGKPKLAVLATLQFTWIWNDFLWPLIFTQSDEKRTIMIGIVNLKGQYSVAWGVQGALSLVASVPTLIIFLFFQRYFIKGMTMGAVKG